MKKTTLRALLSICLAMATVLPASAWERIETIDGAVFEGTIAELDLVLTDEYEGEVVLPRESLDHVEVTPEGLLKATLKDGSEVQGRASASVTINIGLLQRRFPLTAIRTIEFDQFIPLSTTESVEACPLRVEMPLPEVVSSTKKWRVEATSSARCNGTYLTGLTFQRKYAGGYQAAHGAVTIEQLEVTPIMVVGGDGHQTLTIDVRLLQGDQVIGKGRHSLSLGPRARTDVGAVAMRYEQQELEAGGETPLLQIQALLTESSEPPAQSTGMWWFWISF